MRFLIPRNLRFTRSFSLIKKVAILLTASALIPWTFACALLGGRLALILFKVGWKITYPEFSLVYTSVVPFFNFFPTVFATDFEVLVPALNMAVNVSFVTYDRGKPDA